MKNLTERLVVGGVALLVGLILGWMVRGVSSYSADSAVVTPLDDWRVACPAASAKDASCEVSSDIVDKQQGSPIARISITNDKDGAKMIGFVLPHGVALEAGMGLRIGKDPVKIFPYRTCNTVGCLATAPFDDKLASSLKANTEVAILFATLEGKPIAEAVSMKGFSKSYALWRSSDSKRHSWFWRLWS